MKKPKIAQESAESESASSTSEAPCFTVDRTKLMFVRSADNGFRRSCASSARSSGSWLCGGELTGDLLSYHTSWEAQRFYLPELRDAGGDETRNRIASLDHLGN